MRNDSKMITKKILIVDDKVAFLLGGTQDYMTKPFSTKEVLTICNLLLSNIKRLVKNRAFQIAAAQISICQCVSRRKKDINSFIW